MVELSKKQQDKAKSVKVYEPQNKVILKCIEEMCELQKELIEVVYAVSSGSSTEVDLKKVNSEYADVLIAFERASFLFDETEVRKFATKKLNSMAKKVM